MTFSVRGLARSVDGRPLFSGVSFDLMKGERLVVRGASGAGKSQLLRCLAWLSPLDAGEVTLDARTPEAWGVPRWRRRVCYVSQRPGVFPGTPRELASAVSRFSSVTEALPALDEVVEVAVRWGLAARAWDQGWASLSGGEQQRAALAIALRGGPDVLLLDEPTSMLDAESVAAVEEELLGHTLVWVTHDELQAARIGGDVLTLGGS